MEARDEYEKHYRLTDGSFLAAQFQVPVHYEADGVWEDIDNTLTGVALYDGTEVYQSVNGEHVQSFASTLSDGTVLSVADGEQSLTMALWDGGQDAAEPPPAAVTETPETADKEEIPEPSEQPENEQEAEPEETETPSEAKSADAPTVLAGESDDADGEKTPAEGDNEDTPSEELPEADTPEETVEPAPSPAASEDEADAADPTEPETIEEESEPEDTLPTFNREAKAEILTGAASAAAVQAAPAKREVTDVVPETLENAVIYREVYPGVDLKYETYSYNVKESIILNAPAAQSKETDGEANDSRYVYTFRLTLEGLTPELQEDGSILLLNEAGETEYTIPAPFMMDDAGEYSDQVTYALTEDASVWLLTITADSAWLDDDSRVYPVSIDPSIESNSNSANIVGGTAATNTPSQSVHQKWMVAGYHGTHGYMEAYFKINSLPKIPVGSTVTKVSIKLPVADYIPRGDVTAKSTLSMHPVTDSRSGSTWPSELTWSTKPAYGEVIDYYVADGGKIADDHFWDITRAAKQWYEGTAENNGLAVTSDQGPSTAYRIYLDYSVNAALTVIYRSTTGIESYYTYEEQNILRAGNGYVGDYSSSLTIVKDDLSYSSTSLPFTLSHVYNSDLHSGNISDSWLLGVTAADYINMRTGFGWQLSTQESIGKTTIGGTTYLVYRDGDGTMHFFTYVAGSGKYEDEDGLNLTIAPGTSGSIRTYTLKDTSGNTRYFYNDYLTYIKDASGNRICFVYNGKSFSATGTEWYPSTYGSYLSEIYAVSSGGSSSRICALSYDQNHYLASITDYAGRTTKFAYSDLTENSAYLTKVTHPDGTSACYNYDDNGRLSEAYDGEGKYGIAYTYSGNDVTGIREYAAASQGGEKTYGSSIRRSKNGVQEAVYRYDGADHKFYPDDDTTDDIVTRYAFDYAGRTINAATLNWNETEILGVTAAAYTASSGTSKTNNRVEKDAQSGQEGINLMTAGGLEVHDGTLIPSLIRSYN